MILFIYLNWYSFHSTDWLLFSFNAGDNKDRVFNTDGDVYVVWAMGRINELQQVTKHDKRLDGKLFEYILPI